MGNQWKKKAHLLRDTGRTKAAIGLNLVDVKLVALAKGETLKGEAMWNPNALQEIKRE